MLPGNGSGLCSLQSFIAFSGSLDLPYAFSKHLPSQSVLYYVRSRRVKLGTPSDTKERTGLKKRTGKTLKWKGISISGN